MMELPLSKLSALAVILWLLPLTVNARRATNHHREDLQPRLVTASVPKDQDVCFSPDEDCDVKLIKLIQSAQKSIDIAVYDINHEQLVHQILVQSKKIPVRVLVDKRQSKGPKSLVSLLLRAGANVRYGHQRGIMHNKFVIVDRTLVETGSYNYTNHATEANNENQIYLANPPVVKRYSERFEKIWTAGTPALQTRALSSE